MNKQQDLGDTPTDRDKNTFGIRLTLQVIKEEAAAMFHEDRSKPYNDIADYDRALRSDFCRFVTMLLNRAEKRLSPKCEREPNGIGAS